jgi:outer membrane protein assembly factor BamB
MEFDGLIEDREQIAVSISAAGVRIHRSRCCNAGKQVGPAKIKKRSNMKPKFNLLDVLFIFLIGAKEPLAATQLSDDGHWPSFRGEHAAGIAEGQNLPDSWDGEKAVNIKWKTRIPGLAHSSPIVWRDRLFVTTAISSLGDGSFRHGLYGDGDASEDKSVHQWKVYALDKNRGKILWEQTAYEGVPAEKRHIKASYANATPASDGRYVIAFFGSQGLYAFTLDGRLVWKKDLGVLNAGAYDAPDYEWGTASSPIIYQDLVIVQCDTQNEDFLLAVDIQTGKTVWKTSREELPSWGTPTIYPGKSRVELITNASNFIRGYDPITGTELWRLGGSSKITAPTPVYSGDLIVVASGRRPEAPIFTIRAGASGDITLSEGQSSSEHIAWSKKQRGSYMPTPLIYRNHLYVLANQGIFDCYDLKTGEEVYRQRLTHQGGGFSASPVAADGRLYLPGEDGEIFVVKAGPEFELLATNAMGELLMATPAISSGMMFVKTQHHLFAIGK